MGRRLASAEVLLLAMGGCVACGAGFSVDQSNMEVWGRTVSPATTDLNAVPALPQLRSSGPARLYPCATDDGELFDVWAGREWVDPTPGVIERHRASLSAGEGFMTILHTLQRRAWKAVSHQAGDAGGLTSANPRFNEVNLVKRVDDIAPRIELAVMPGAIIATVTFPDAPVVCHQNQ